jgi:hypothetical protein
VRAKLLLGISLTASVIALSGHWEFVQNTEDITVDRIVTGDSPVVLFRGRAVVNAPVSALMAVILDYRTQTEWNNTGYDLKVLQKISDSELFFYSALRAPWPVKDRDFVIKLDTVFTPAIRQIEIKGSEVAHVAAPKRHDRVRLPLCRINWVLMALPGNKTHVAVTFQIYHESRNSGHALSGLAQHTQAYRRWWL